ncbi:DUF1636 family protein [Aestuariivirga sp.]|uniref:DUF1636 family protein n=1 Tax=Aestuariivirga sp. TaxID=2650926 RepID=UPI0039E27FF4
MAHSGYSHIIIVCTTCRHTGLTCRPGYDLIAKLNAALVAAGPALANDFQVSGTSCLAGCSRPCTVAFRADAKATYVFGDISDDCDVEALVQFAGLYAVRGDGMSKASEHPQELRFKTLARIPAAVIACVPRGGAIQ